MDDDGRKEADKALASLERKLNRTYREAKENAEEKFLRYMRDFADKDARHKRDVESGKWTEEQYESWWKNQLLYAGTLSGIKETIAKDLRNTDKIAMEVARGERPEIYAMGFNYGTYSAEAGAGVDTSFTLYDKSTVEQLMRDDPELLPRPSAKRQREIDASGLAWNKRRLTSAFTASILAGDSIPKMAQRISGVADMNARAAIRNARTMCTGAENAGRVDSMKRAEGMGINMEQEWAAALDGRTRDSHRMVDGEKVKPGEKFSNGLRFPGDPDGPASEVYNCRCTLIPVVDGVDPMAFNKSDVLQRKTGNKGITYSEWKKEHREKRSGLGAGETGTTVPAHKAAELIEELPDITMEQIEERFREFEDAHVEDDIEHALVVTKDGKIYHCYGVHEGVFPDEDLGEEFVGASVTHTHPADVTQYSFGIQDRQTFNSYKLEVLQGADIKYKYRLAREDSDIDPEIPITEMTEEDAEHSMSILFAEQFGYGYRRKKA